MRNADRGGFTLLELVITIIILGVLASLALPRFVRVVERSRGAEAIVALGTVRNAMDRCQLMNSGSLLGCDWKAYIDDPFGSPGSHFYMHEGSVNGDGSYMKIAIRNDFELSVPHEPSHITCPNNGSSASFAASAIALCVSTSGEAKIIGGGIYEGMK